MRWTRLRTLSGALMVLFALTLAFVPAVSAKDSDKDTHRDRDHHAVTTQIASLTVAPADTPGWFNASARNYGHDETLQITATGPDQGIVGLPTVTTDGNGAADFNFQMPRYEQDGQWMLAV